MKIYLFLLFISTQAFALQCYEDENPLLLFGGEILNVLPQKKCPSIDEKILKQTEDEYKKYYGNEAQVLASVKGFNLKGSQKEIELANTMLGKKPPKGWSSAAQDCETLQCAFVKLLNSKEAAMQLFNIHAKSGYLLSLDQTINQGLGEQIWSAKEIRELDAGVSKLPPELIKLTHLKVIERIGDGLKLGTHSGRNVAAFASPYIRGQKDAELVFYDTALQDFAKNNPYNSRSWPQEVLIHELCHHYDFKGYYASGSGIMTSEQKNSEFSKLSGWRRKATSEGTDGWLSSPEAHFVSAYASTQPVEDFAETCMNYVLNPDSLQKKAPAKYTFMKEKVFNQQVFDDKIWSNAEKAWPSLGALLNGERNCNFKLIECVNDITYDSGEFCQRDKPRINGTVTTTTISCGDSLALLKSNSCLDEYKTNRLNEIDKTLQADEGYCSMGGAGIIRDNKDKICEDSINQLASNLAKLSELDLTDDILNCEKNKDFTNECITKKVLKDLEVDPDMDLATRKIANSMIPDRMKALSNELSTMDTSKWLKPCLNVISKITKYQSTGSDGTLSYVFLYNSKSDEFQNGYLARYINDYREEKDISMACSQEILKALQTGGYKTPNEKPTRLFNETITAEIRSFEDNVIGKIRESTRECRNRACKTKKITELLQVWENEVPDKRKGFATEEFAHELVNIAGS